MDLLNHCVSMAFWIYCKCIFFVYSTTAVEVWCWLPFWTSQHYHFLHNYVNLMPNLEDQAFYFEVCSPSKVDKHA